MSKEQEFREHLEETSGQFKNEIEANQYLSSQARIAGMVTAADMLQTKKLWGKNGTAKQLLKARKSAWIHNLVHLDGAKFDFSGRDYLRQIYDAPYSHKLLLTGRQVEKCMSHRVNVSLASGEELPVTKIRPGYYLSAADESGRNCFTKVLASEGNGPKPCLKITTRLGSTLEVTKNHPLRKLLSWVLAEDLVVGDRLASLRTVGTFGNLSNPWAGLLGLLLGDGCLCLRGEEKINFCQGNEETANWFLRLLQPYDQGKTLKIHDKEGTHAKSYWFEAFEELDNFLSRHNMWGTRSETKFIPQECMEWDRASTRDLLRGLWATDGHCKNINRGKVDLVYCSTSQLLIRHIQLLLRKFGIVTTLREYQPKMKNAKRAYIIRVVTRKSIEAFHREIGPIPGRPFTIPEVESNSNLDTVPKDIYPILDAAKKRAGYGVKKGPKCFERDAGFRFVYKYAPTYEKLAAAQTILKDEIIQKTLDSDIIWDEIVSIEDIGMQETWSIQTETETYISDFIVNHNSSMLANEIIANSVIIPWHRSLYVSPSHDQSRQFSNSKLKPWIESSPLIAKYFQSTSVSRQVFEKSFTNGAICFLRSAFLNADRTRGISADLLALDEIQDILTSNIPVIEECLSHSKYGNKIFSGTPKTLENTIQQYWDISSQCEWLVPCDRHTPVHWNYLDERSIGKTGPICNQCGKPINPAAGKWYSFSKSRDIMGFRISQIMVPWIYQIPKKWNDFLFKYENYSKGQFYNEVLGISYDSASKPITQSDLIACCSKKHPIRSEPDHWTSRVQIFAGVDWGEGTDGTERGAKGKIKNASYTVLSLGVYLSPKVFHYIYLKRFTGKEAAPSHCIAEIIATLKKFGVVCAGVDWGHGWGVNEQLEIAMGPQRVVKFQYVGNQRERKKFDDVGIKYQLSRTEVMTDFFTSIKEQEIVWPDWNDVREYLCDIEHVYAEYSTGSKSLIYDHKASEPDDALHSMILCRESADNYFGTKR